MNGGDWTSAKARLYFWTTILVATAAGTFLPTLCGWNYRCDVLEQLLIGRLWVPGSFKHPGLTTWIAEIFRIATFRADFAPYLASNVCVAGMIWSVWRLSRSFMSERSAVLAALSTYLIYFFSVENHLFNNNTTLCCFWAATVFVFHKALLKNKLRHWILAGALLGCAFLGKYVAIILAASIVLYLTTNKKARAYWRTPGPYLAAAATLAVFSINLWFLLANFETLSKYSQGGSVSLAAFPLKFLESWLKQLPIVAPVFLALSPLVDWRRLTKEGRRAFRKPSENDGCERSFDADFLAKMFLFPILVQTCVQFVELLPLRWPAYTSHFWPLLGAVVLAYFPRFAIASNVAGSAGSANSFDRPDGPDERRATWAVRLVSIGIVAFFASIPLHMTACVYFGSKPSGRYFDGKGIAKKIDAAWSERFAAAPRYVAGDDGHPLFLAWEYVVYSRFEPTLDSPPLGPWATDADLEQKGGIVVWRVRDDSEKTQIPDRWKSRFPTARFVETFDVKYRQKTPNIPLETVGFAFVAPPVASSLDKIHRAPLLNSTVEPTSRKDLR